MSKTSHSLENSETLIPVYPLVTYTMELTQPDTSDENTERASFDLTDFGSANTWLELLKRHGLTRTPYYDGEGFEWSTNDKQLIVHTYCNPYTGERVSRIGSPSEKEEGYASYIHVIGDKDLVESFYGDARQSADMIDGGCALGEFIV